MSDSKETQPFAAQGSGKSPEEIAFELVNKLKGQGVWGERNISAILDMYAECLDAAKGLRAYPGQNRVEAPIQGAEPSSVPTTPTAVETSVSSSADAAPSEPDLILEPEVEPQAPVQAPPMPEVATPEPDIFEAVNSHFDAVDAVFSELDRNPSANVQSHIPQQVYKQG